MRIQIPDEAIEYLRHLLDRDGARQWEIGRFVSDFWQETLKHLEPGEVGEAHATMIKDFAVGTGADKSTLRDRENMWMFFSNEDRERYEVLTYHQFRALKSAGIEEWQRWAEWALINGYQGRPASVARIRKAIDDEKNPEPLWVLRLARIIALVDKMMADEELPRAVRIDMIEVSIIVQATKELA